MSSDWSFASPPIFQAMSQRQRSKATDAKALILGVHANLQTFFRDTNLTRFNRRWLNLSQGQNILIRTPIRLDLIPMDELAVRGRATVTDRVSPKVASVS